MKYRVIHPRYSPAYFKTKKEASLFQQKIGGEIQRKIGYEWVSY